MPKLIAPPASSFFIRKVMRGNRAMDTRPELEFRSALTRQGLRGYRKYRRDIPGNPDVVYTRHRIAIFLNGCFWHRCPICKIPYPSTNSKYWREKIDRNVKRDRQNYQKLRQLGWRVQVFWECQIQKNVDSCAKKTYKAIWGATK
jgi:DNA mismatch endonuclease (patch repair protein)